MALTAQEALKEGVKSFNLFSDSLNSFLQTLEPIKDRVVQTSILEVIKGHQARVASLPKKIEEGKISLEDAESDLQRVLKDFNRLLNSPRMVKILNGKDITPFRVNINAVNSKFEDDKKSEKDKAWKLLEAKPKVPEANLNIKADEKSPDKEADPVQREDISDTKTAKSHSNSIRLPVELFPAAIGYGLASTANNSSNRKDSEVGFDFHKRATERLGTKDSILEIGDGKFGVGLSGKFLGRQGSITATGNAGENQTFLGLANVLTNDRAQIDLGLGVERRNITPAGRIAYEYNDSTKFGEGSYRASANALYAPTGNSRTNLEVSGEFDWRGFNQTWNNNKETSYLNFNVSPEISTNRGFELPFAGVTHNYRKVLVANPLETRDQFLNAEIGVGVSTERSLGRSYDLGVVYKIGTEGRKEERYYFAEAGGFSSLRGTKMFASTGIGFQPKGSRDRFGIDLTFGDKPGSVPMARNLFGIRGLSLGFFWRRSF